MADAKHKTVVRVAGKEYTLISEDDPAYLRRVAAYVDRKMSETALAAHVSASQTGTLVAISVTDEMLKAQDENIRLRKEILKLREQLKTQETAAQA